MFGRLSNGDAEPNGFGRSPTILHLLVLMLLTLVVNKVCGQSYTFGGNPQHTAQFNVPAQHLNRLRWSGLVSSPGSFSHYGAPLVTASNTVIWSTVSGATFALNATDGLTGTNKYSLATDYRSPNIPWGTSYGPVLVQGPLGLRLYYAGAGGTVFYIDNVDSDSPTIPKQLCFYMPIGDYLTNTTAYTNRVFINTPLTADANGAIFFGFRVSGTAPGPLNTTNSGIARIDPVGSGTYISTTSAATDTRAYLDVHNCAPALSLDGSTVYVTAKGGAVAFLLGLDSATLVPKYKVLLRDPRNGNSTDLPDMATASPTVGPDGDVYMGVAATPDNGSMGFMLHFNADLATNKLPSAFGWDYTPGIVPAGLVSAYKGSSTYLLFSKYNNYNAGDYRVALLDPNAWETNQGIRVMREVLIMRGPTTSREWCINSPAVNIATASVFAPSEDGRIYRWDLRSNSLSEVFGLTSGFGEPYVPTVIGPDGAVYTINSSRLFALDAPTNLVVAASSSVPDDRLLVAGQPVTFTANVSNPLDPDLPPAGVVSFYDGTPALGTNISLTNGSASLTVSNLAAGSAHLIRVAFTGESLGQTGSVSIIQRVHLRQSSMVLTSSVPVLGSNSVTFTAFITSAAGGTPSGYAAFWDGPAFLGQIALSSGRASLAVTNFSPASHAVTADYSSDTVYTSCNRAVQGRAGPISSVLTLPDGSIQLSFTNMSGAPYTILASPDITLPLSNWVALGTALEYSPGKFQFIDSQATVGGTARYYRVRSP